jgi:hypothetical protein
MLTQDQIQALKAPFPPEALSSDTSRGFELTSIKAAQAPAVIERLNEVFCPCGVGWRYVHSPFEELHTDIGRAKIVTEVALPENPPPARSGTWAAAPRPRGWSCQPTLSACPG